MFTVDIREELSKKTIEEQVLEMQAEEFAKGIITEENRKDAEFLNQRFGMMNDDTEAMKAVESLGAMKKKYGDELYSSAQIKRMCIKYRLRFLPAQLYKGKVDLRLAGAIRDFQKEHLRDDLHIHIMAPASSFRLKLRRDIPDPIAFVYVGRGMYKLLLKWGNDLSGTRALWGWMLTIPAIMALFCILVLLSIVVSLCVWGGASGWLMAIIFGGLWCIPGVGLLVNSEKWCSDEVWNSQVK